MKSFSSLVITLGLSLVSLAVTQAVWIKTACVDITESRPCLDYPDAKYHVCYACHLGHFAKCQDDRLVTVLPCPRVQDESGISRRLLFDPLTQACQRETVSCQLNERKSRWH